MKAHKIRMQCLALAKGMTSDPETMLRVALSLEGYVVCGFDTGMGLLRTHYYGEPAPLAQPAPVAPTALVDDDEPGGDAVQLH